MSPASTSTSSSPSPSSPPPPPPIMMSVASRFWEPNKRRENGVTVVASNVLCSSSWQWSIVLWNKKTKGNVNDSTFTSQDEWHQSQMHYTIHWILRFFYFFEVNQYLIGATFGAFSLSLLHIMNSIKTMNHQRTTVLEKKTSLAIIISVGSINIRQAIAVQLPFWPRGRVKE